MQGKMIQEVSYKRMPEMASGTSSSHFDAPFGGIWGDPRRWRPFEAVRQGATARLLVSFDGDGAGHLVGVDVAEVLELAGLVEADREGLGDRSFGDLGHGVAAGSVADVEVVLDAVVAVVEGDLEPLADASGQLAGVEADILPDDRDGLARAGRRRLGRHRIGAQVGVAVAAAACSGSQGGGEHGNSHKWVGAHRCHSRGILRVPGPDPPAWRTACERPVGRGWWAADQAGGREV